MPRDYKVYLDDILLAIERVQTYTAGYTQEKFCDDLRTVDAVVRNLEVIGEAVKHIPQDIRDQRPEVEWRKIGALRDILAHEYGLKEQVQKLV